MITQKYLKSILYYNPETGWFTWIIFNKYHLDLYRKRAGALSGSGYRYIKIDNIKISEQILAWLYMTGEYPKGEIDHKDGVKDNNKWNNLRKTNRSGNQHNRKIQMNVSGYKGVSSNNDKWMSRIAIDRKQICLGTFDTKEEAAIAYNIAALENYGPFVKCNIIDNCYSYQRKDAFGTTTRHL